MSNQFVAFQDDRHGLGAWVAEQVAALSFGAPPGAAPRQRVTPPVATADHGLSLSSGDPVSGAESVVLDRPAASAAGRSRTWTSPRSTAESTISAVASGQASFGVLPLFGENGFDQETLAALIDFPQAQGVREYVASSNYVLAVPTDLIHEAEQAGFTDSFSSGGNAFKWTPEKQRKYRNKIATVYAGADAMQHCAPAIEGIRAKGIDVQLVPDGVDSYREGLKLAASILDPDREVVTRFGNDGQERRSTTKGANAQKGLIGVLLTLDKAVGETGYAYDADYTVVDAQMAGADPVRTSYLAVARAERSDFDDYASLRGAVSALRAAFQADPQRLPQVKGSGRGKGTVGDPSGQRYGARLVRVLWKADTVREDGRGGRTADYWPVLGLLAKAGLPYRVTQLESRSGRPVVIAFDVMRGRERAAMPALRAMSRLSGSRRLAIFPATEALDDAPAASGGSWGKMALILLGIAGAVALAGQLLPILG